MTSPFPRKFTIALLAQVLFCLVSAPIFAAQRVCISAKAEQGNQAPSDTRGSIGGIFDASASKPEDECGSDTQKKGKRRGVKAGRALACSPVASWPQAVGAVSASDAPCLQSLSSTLRSTGSGGSTTAAAADFIALPEADATPLLRVASVERTTPRTFSASCPAVTPTGPPSRI